MPTRKRQSVSETRKEEHLRLLTQLSQLPLADSCCELCHCDCYSSHRSSELSVAGTRIDVDEENLQHYELPIITRTSSKQRHAATTLNEHKRQSVVKHNSKTNERNSRCARAKTKKKRRSSCDTTTHTASKCEQLSQRSHKSSIKRSKSASSLRANSPQPSAANFARNQRDCRVLQELLTPRAAQEPVAVSNAIMAGTTKQLSPWSRTQHLAPLQLCESMANLCLVPAVREAYQLVPEHDQKILNRMANKRTERAVAKEHAWLARKYWENERYERELFKCAQMEEYKRAVRDKQFQDYLVTKERLNELAQRDWSELQRLRHALHEKDERARRRIDNMRIERDIQLCQRRCEELDKSEAANVLQEEQQLDEGLRKRALCQRLTERLNRADEIRSQLLDGYLKRLRYDNHLEKLLHEEHWREQQQLELAKREQLKEHISHKRNKSQRFVEQRQRRHATLSKTAKISASLRELVRNSVTPESALLGAVDGAGAGAAPTPLALGRLLLLE